MKAVLPQSRMQATILIAFGVVVVLLLVVYGLSTLMTSRAETLATLQTKENQLSQITTTIKAIPALRRNRDDLFWGIQEAASNYVLYHEYRNYHLTAREILLPMAAGFDITIDIPREGSILDFPIPDSKVTDKLIKAAPKNPREYSGPISSTFSLYAVTLTGKGGFLPLLEFLRKIEESNPYLAITDVSIREDEQNPEVHPFSFTLLWPIWKNLELKPKPEDLFMPIQDNANTPETP